MMYSKTWKTFPDFLGDYIKVRLGSDWGNAEIAKPESERHILIQWYQKVCYLQEKHRTNPDSIFSCPVTGLVTAYLGLAYNLYCLEHNEALQEALLSRLKNPDSNFHGVRYELAVAAYMVRAGFEVQFEDESDRRTTHCEFTATSKISGNKYSVECKRLDSFPAAGQVNLKKLGKRFSNALHKKANHQRIVFIDLNFPYSPSNGVDLPPAFELAEHHIKKFERNRANGENLPPAYVILTNSPHIHHLDDEGIQNAFLCVGFKTPEMDANVNITFDQALINREKLKDITHLIDSISRHSNIPSTFDSELPEFAFNESLKNNRLLIGKKYTVPDENGEMIDATLVQAVFSVQLQKTQAVMRTEEGKRLLVTFDMHPDEVRAYKTSPKTFYGVLDESAERKPLKTLLDYYDFFLKGCEGTSKEVLLERLKNHPKIEDLTKLTPQELVKEYAKMLAFRAFNNHTKIHQS